RLREDAGAAGVEWPPVALFDLDAQARIVTLNRSAAVLLDAEAEAALGRDFCAFVAPESRPACLALLADIGADDARQAELGFAGASRQRRVVTAARAGASLRLTAAERGPRPAPADTAFIAALSRELRAASDDFIGLNRLAARAAANPGRSARLDRLDPASSRLLGLSDDLLELALAEAEGTAAEGSDFLLDELLAQALAAAAARVRTPSTVRLTIDPPLATPLHGRARTLGLVLRHWVAAALEGERPGALELYCAPGAARGERIGLKFSLRTADGKPLRIGSPFEFGLAQRLAQALGAELAGDSPRRAEWQLDVTLERGRGAPQRAAPKAQEPATMSAGDWERRVRRDHAGRRVLLVEDNPINQELAADLLREAGLEVELAEDGARAVERAASGQFDLVLMDIAMPVMDGLTATRAIRARLGPALPIIAVTAGAFESDRRASLEAGMNDHLSKPVDPTTLYAALARWLPAPRPAAPGAASNRAAPLTPAAEAALRARLAGVHGLDYDAALRNLGGRLHVFERVLAKFVERYRQGDPVLAAPTGASLSERWRRACHSQRGACAAIGALALEARLGAFESRLDPQAPWSDYEAEARELQDALAAFVQALAAALA
ncbi:MAG: response regulator, partial [Burkholderiales bacterium]|nr:response regulator [Burkholderiales bacterium]